MKGDAKSREFGNRVDESAVHTGSDEHGPAADPRNEVGKPHEPAGKDASDRNRERESGEWFRGTG